MIGAVAVAIDHLRRVIVEADVEIIAIDRTGIAVNELDARSRGRLQDDTQVAAPAVRREQAEIDVADDIAGADRSEEHTSELQSLMRISYAVFCLKKKKCKKCTP